MDMHRQRRRRLTEQEDVDDDEERLVRQVLAENPPEERGERDEWAEHVGWHRKEDTHDQHANNVVDAATDDDPLGGNDGEDIAVEPSKEDENAGGGGRLSLTDEQIVTEPIPQKLRGAKILDTSRRLQTPNSTATNMKPFVGVGFTIVIFLTCVSFLRRRVPKKTKDML